MARSRWWWWWYADVNGLSPVRSLDNQNEALKSAVNEAFMIMSWSSGNA